MNLKTIVTLIGLLILASLLGACKTREVIKTVEVPVEVTSVVEEETEYITLSTLAEDIRAGELDVGDEYGLAPDQRFHRIHANTIEMACTQCHVQEAPYEVAEPAPGAPGAVDRRVCLGCHLTGPATKLYDPKE